ncbi:3-hydroxybutyrate dehydrogenase [Roseovarius sp. LXJ103]|uniref:3-hydroxybutyrate dehydrogenase n=1 Tax=Roseovarius carneus TaxID=2853164 RepID=UPI000D605D23|nr:3-hydroxybutyrate dehydrogenase [Roseovarius carneus]MBZ8118768.1 3-hydroxybutyrate dehydrogenase [Roseovarius carneus]PWE35560.1 3-hydroxybutyrate dehydrogenase [Pelagicola sp. LXJ1103]
MVDLTGRTALVTGGMQGVGRGVARAFARAGARIALNDLPGRDASAVLAELAELGAGGVQYFGADLEQPAQIDAMLAQVAAWGAVDILVNNAGIGQTGPLADLPRAVWDRVLAINLSAPFALMQGLLPGMSARGYGRVINVASIHGLVGNPGKAAYATAKHGLVGLSRVAAMEYAEAGSRMSGGVTVNAICPGWVDTPLVQSMVAARQDALGTTREEAIANLLGTKQPTRRGIDPEEIGAMALWLTDPLSHNVTGAALPLDGGWTAH